MNKARIHDILSTMRQRIELEDDDFHYDALLEAEEQLGVIADLYEALKDVLDYYGIQEGRGREALAKAES